MAAKRLAVLISGNGSNLQAIMDATASGQINGQIVTVISNNADAFGLSRAQQAGIATGVIDHRQYAERADFDQALQQAIDAQQIDLVILAGFMRILSAGFVQHYAGRLMNIHPSLLPLYKGLNTHQRALAGGDQQHGCTVHFVTEELDGGPAIVQALVPIYPDDDPHSLQTRVHQREHVAYPLAVEWFCADRLHLTPAGVDYDGQLLPAGGVPLPYPTTDQEAS